MQVAQRHPVVDMSDPAALRAVLEAERARPCAQLLVVAELEAIATPVLLELEAHGLHVVPTARAALGPAGECAKRSVPSTQNWAFRGSRTGWCGRPAET